MNAAKEKTLSQKKLRTNKYKKKGLQNKAKDNIEELFRVARELFEKNPKYANNCARLARRISMRYKTPFNKQQKIQYCKKCNTYLVPLKTSRVRVSCGKIKVLCLNCKNISRYAYK